MSCGLLLASLPYLHAFILVHGRMKEYDPSWRERIALEHSLLSKNAQLLRGCLHMVQLWMPLMTMFGWERAHALTQW